MSVSIKEAVDAYVLSTNKNRYRKISKDIVINLLLGIKDNPKGKAKVKTNTDPISFNSSDDKDFAFLKQDGLSSEMKVSDIEAEEYIKRAIKSSIKKYPKSKITAIEVYKDLIEYINKEYGATISVLFPEWLPKTSLERQIHIAKILHDPDVSLSELSDVLYVSEKTIDTDLKRLKGEDDPLEVMGQKLIVDFNRRKGRLSFPSTVHPLFLTFNLTQVITTLEGLKKMSKDAEYKNYALNAAITIWAQLSEYAKHRIFSVSDGLGIDTSWYKSLDIGNNNLFYTESMCSTIYGAQSLMECYKNGRQCFIEYIDDNDSTFIYKNCIIVSFKDDTVTVNINGSEVILQKNWVVKAALNENELY